MKIQEYIPGTCFLSIIYWLPTLSVNAELSDDELIDFITEDKQTLAAEQLSKLSGRAEVRRKKSPPAGDIFAAGLEPDTLECDKTYSIDKEGFLFFRLTPAKQPCKYSFLGSRRHGCTVAMLCRGKISLASPTGGNCEKEYLELRDGTNGLMKGCGDFTFGSKPRISRNNGTDLYVTMMGSSPKRCVVLCTDELGKNRPGVKETAQIAMDPKKASKSGLSGRFSSYDDLYSSCTCGQRKDYGRVVGGETAFKFEFPWLGSIVFKRGSHNRSPFCGGSLINDRYFVTAAHCFAIQGVKANQIQVVLHNHVMDKRIPRGMSPDSPELQSIPGWDLPVETDSSENSIRLDVAEIINHPLFDQNTFDWDVTVLKFQTPLQLEGNNLISPICLPDYYSKSSYSDGLSLVVAGWGKPWETAKSGARILQKLTVPFVNRESCRGFTTPSARHLCAGYTEGGKDACAGDSGGPLIARTDMVNNVYILAGVVSAGAGCARQNKLGLYTDVQEVLEWVLYQTANAKWCTKPGAQYDY